MNSAPIALPSALEKIFSAAQQTKQELDVTFTALMSALCDVWQCDRCFLYLRDPKTAQGRVTHCHSTSPEWEDMTRSDWVEEGDIASKDPLMAIAFRTSESIFVEDIETAGTEVVNLPLEQEVYKHRAFIHIPIYDQGQLCGILEPCVFGQPRIWTAGDRAIAPLIQEKLAPLVRQYLTVVFA